MWEGWIIPWGSNGKLLFDGVRSYEYDHVNRLTQITGTLTTQYAYNGDGNRIRKTVDGITTQYVLDLAATLPVVISDTEAIYVRLDAINAKREGSIARALSSYMAGTTGFEPAISCLTGRYVKPSYTTPPQSLSYLTINLLFSQMVIIRGGLAQRLGTSPKVSPNLRKIRLDVIIRD